MNVGIEDTRRRLIELLSKWHAKDLTAGDIHREAEAELQNYEWVDAPKPDNRSIVNEVLAHLDALNQQLIIREDVPIILDFLRTPTGTELEAWQQWEAYWERIDYQERNRLLKGNPFYAT